MADQPSFGEWNLSQAQNRYWRYVFANGEQYLEYRDSPNQLRRVQPAHAASQQLAQPTSEVPRSSGADPRSQGSTALTQSPHQQHYELHTQASHPFHRFSNSTEGSHPSYSDPRRSSSLSSQEQHPFELEASTARLSSSPEVGSRLTPSTSAHDRLYDYNAQRQRSREPSTRRRPSVDDAGEYPPTSLGRVTSHTDEHPLARTGNESITHDFAALSFQESSQSNTAVPAPETPSLAASPIVFDVSSDGEIFRALVDRTSRYSLVRNTFPGEMLAMTNKTLDREAWALNRSLKLQKGKRFYMFTYECTYFQSPVSDLFLMSPSDFANCDIIFGQDWWDGHHPIIGWRDGRPFISNCQVTHIHRPRTADRRGSIAAASQQSATALQPVKEHSTTQTFPNMISARPSKSLYENLDKDYMKRDKPRNYFKPGRVFAMLWHENVGNNGTEMTNQVEFPQTRGKYNESVYGSIRRMVVIRPMEGCCWCCPITTYSGRGVAKPGLTPESIRHHTIIHMIGTPAARKASELGMTKSPIAVDPSTPREKLDQMSRLNFGKIYTVEHNVKVKSVGTVTKESMPNFEAYIVNVLTGN